MTWVVIWHSNRSTLCFSDNMVFMGYQLPEGRKPGRWIFCSPSMNLMIKSLWFVNFKTLKLQPERPGSSCTKQEKQFHGNLQPVWYNEKKNLHYDIMTIMGNSTASPSLDLRYPIPDRQIDPRAWPPLGHKQWRLVMITTTENFFKCYDHTRLHA